jgi:hypothetical protein
MAKMNAYFERIELGHIDISEEEKMLKYDQYEILESSYKQILTEKAKLNEPTIIIRTIGEWIFSLERLKDGRWTRFGASDEVLIKVTLLQSQMCDRLLGLYKLLAQAVGNNSEIASMSKDIKKITELSIGLNEDLTAYIKMFGMGAFSS